MTQLRCLAVPPPVPTAIVAAAVTCGVVAAVAAALAGVYAWHRLRGPLPLVAWAASWCARPRGGGAAGVEEALASLRMPESALVQVMRRGL